MNKYTTALLAVLTVLNIQAEDRTLLLTARQAALAHEFKLITDEKIKEKAQEEDRGAKSWEKKIKSLIAAHDNNTLKFCTEDWREEIEVTHIFYKSIDDFGGYTDEVNECIELLHQLRTQNKLKDPNKSIITATGGQQGWYTVSCKNNKFFLKRKG